MHESQPLFTHAQLTANGLTESDIRARLASGSLTRVRRGVYARAVELTPVDEHLRLVRATVPGVARTNVLSHQSAGCLHGLPVPRDQLGQVAMTRRKGGHGSARRQLRVHNFPIPDDEVTTVDGLHVTTLARTTFDLARTLDYPQAVAVSDGALRTGLQRQDLLDVVDRHKGMHGRARARMAAEFAEPLAESPAESISRTQLALHGVPAPVLQFPVVNADGLQVARADFAWPELRLVGEVDGKWKYGELLRPGQSPETAIMEEKGREQDIRDAGYWIVRWDWSLALRGEELARRVQRAIQQQRRLLGI